MESFIMNCELNYHNILVAIFESNRFSRLDKPFTSTNKYLSTTGIEELEVTNEFSKVLAGQSFGVKFFAGSWWNFWCNVFRKVAVMFQAPEMSQLKEVLT